MSFLFPLSNATEGVEDKGDSVNAERTWVY